MCYEFLRRRGALPGRLRSWATSIIELLGVGCKRILSVMDESESWKLIGRVAGYLLKTLVGIGVPAVLALQVWFVTEIHNLDIEQIELQLTMAQSLASIDKDLAFVRHEMEDAGKEREQIRIEISAGTRQREQLQQAIAACERLLQEHR